MSLACRAGHRGRHTRGLSVFWIIFLTLFSRVAAENNVREAPGAVTRDARAGQALAPEASMPAIQFSLVRTGRSSGDAGAPGGLAMSAASRAPTDILSVPSASPPAFSFRTLVGDFLKDTGAIWTYPAHVKIQDTLPIFALAVSLAALIPNDAGIHKGVIDFRDDHLWVRRVSPVITQMGAYGAWGAAGAFLGAGLIFKDRKAAETGLLAVEALLQTSIVIQVAKAAAGRVRPFSTGGVDHWYGPASVLDPDGRSFATSDSFPSGHSALAFSLATVIAMQYSDKAWVPITAYTVAAAVGISRVTLDEHWLSDVVVGGFVGHFIARLIVKNYYKRHPVQPIIAVGPRMLVVGASFSLR